MNKRPQQSCTLRTVFMGTPEFAAHILQTLINAGVNIVGVVTVPDKPAGRGQKLTQSAVKQIATAHGLKVLQPVKLKDPLFIEELAALQPDVQAVVAFRMLPEAVWNLPPQGSFNLHASLLPQYRGAAPVNHAIINGEKETGVTTFFLDQSIDTGNIIFSEKITVNPDETAGTLHNRLMTVGAQLVIKTLDAIASGTAVQMPQPQIPASELKNAPKIFKNDCQINWNMPAETIVNKIKGLSPYPTAFTELTDPLGNTTALKIFFARTAGGTNLLPGQTWSDNKKTLRVGTLAGNIELTEIQLAGKKRLKIEEFLRGYKWNEGVQLK